MLNSVNSTNQLKNIIGKKYNHVSYSRSICKTTDKVDMIKDTSHIITEMTTKQLKCMNTVMFVVLVRRISLFIHSCSFLLVRSVWTWLSGINTWMYFIWSATDSDYTLVRHTWKYQCQDYHSYYVIQDGHLYSIFTIKDLNSWK